MEIRTLRSKTYCLTALRGLQKVLAAGVQGKPMTKYLLDTCIWRDFYENRVSKRGTLLGQQATTFIVKLIKNGNTILFSEALIWELRNEYDENEVKDMLNVLFINRTLVRMEITKEEHWEAKCLSNERNLPFINCLNAVQARNHNAILVTQDVHYFKQLSDVIKPIRPS